MPSSTLKPLGAEPEQREWIVEFNFAGCQVLRWAQKRRHLLGLNPSILGLPHLPLLHSHAV